MCAFISFFPRLGWVQKLFMVRVCTVLYMQCVSTDIHTVPLHQQQQQHLTSVVPLYHSTGSPHLLYYFPTFLSLFSYCTSSFSMYIAPLVSSLFFLLYYVPSPPIPTFFFLYLTPHSPTSCLLLSQSIPSPTYSTFHPYPSIALYLIFTSLKHHIPTPYLAYDIIYMIFSSPYPGIVS